jgi:hypothetical protein
MMTVDVIDRVNLEFTMNRSKGFLKGTGGLICVAAAMVAAPMIASAAEVVYQADKKDPTSKITTSSTVNTFGDEINLAGGYDEVFINKFSFSYSVSAQLQMQANKTITFSLHQMDGPLVSGRSSPGTVIESWILPVVASGNGNVPVNITIANGLMVPSNLGWTISVANLASNERVGLWLANTAVGSSLNDYWVKTGSSWGLATIAGGAVPGTFAATVLAVPEPSVGQLGLIGFAFLFGSRFMRRK